MFKLIYAICLTLVAVELALEFVDMRVLFKAVEMFGCKVDSLCYFLLIKLSFLMTLLLLISVFIFEVLLYIYLVFPLF